MSINFPPINREVYYAFSSRIGGKLSLLVALRTLSLLRSRNKSTPIHSHWDVHRFGS
jgi:hypothetical protein